MSIHHRPDPETSLEENLGALDHAVRSGKALYAGLSNYPGPLFAEAIRVCQQNGFMKPILEVIPKLYICFDYCYFSSNRFISYGLKRINITTMVGN